jgi:hypothetical protein
LSFLYVDACHQKNIASIAFVAGILEQLMVFGASGKCVKNNGPRLREHVIVSDRRFVPNGIRVDHHVPLCHVEGIAVEYTVSGIE